MDRESVDRLRFDRRLQRRPGWVEESDFSGHLESLVDVSEKMTTAAELEAEEAAAAAAAPPASEPVPPVSQQAPSAAPGMGDSRPSVGLAGDFSSSSTASSGTLSSGTPSSGTPSSDTPSSGTAGGGAFGGGSGGTSES